MGFSSNEIVCPGVDHFLLLIDDVFPQSQPRIVVPQADQDYLWPHVEPGGLLCLKNTLVNADPAQRLLQHICAAQELLNFSEEERRQEFVREFTSYWNHKRNHKRVFGRYVILSLLAPINSSREIFSFIDISNQRVIVADDCTSLKEWLRNNSVNQPDIQIISTWLEWLARPWIPKEFPESGRDVLTLLPQDVVNRILHPGQCCIVMFGSSTATGVVLAATVLHGDTEKNIIKGFRELTRVPVVNIENSFARRSVSRCPVLRVDGSWIHGRDHDPIFPYISKQKVAFIGCGALGSAIGRLLAQAGLGNFILVDPDNICPQNTSRHVLGQRFLGKNKAIAMAEMLREDFPHLANVIPISRSFGTLTADQRDKLLNCDVIVSSGIDFDGDAQIDIWRQAKQHSPVHICTWVEAFAIVGHAVALFGTDSLLVAFDEKERFRFRLTEWQEHSGAMIFEAGCGNVFQPHGAIELQFTVSMASGLVLDVLSGKVSKSLRRVWQGDRGRGRES